jgi:hypothetical protein
MFCQRRESQDIIAESYRGKEMLEAKIVEYCSPTLAGLKPANLFNYEYLSTDKLSEEIREVNAKLNKKGVFVEPLKITARMALLYVYRKNKLTEEMKKPGVGEFLKSCGCNECDEECCVGYLRSRLTGNDGFPHEIGLFLGYPLEDVIGFINHKGRNCKCRGTWKVYANEEEKMKLFKKFKKCTSVYHEQFAAGKSIVQLTVAA